MNFKQAIKIMSDSVPKEITWSVDLEHYCQSPLSHQSEVIHIEQRRIWLSEPARKFFGNGKSWQSAVDEVLVFLRDHDEYRRSG